MPRAMLEVPRGADWRTLGAYTAQEPGESAHHGSFCRPCLVNCPTNCEKAQLMASLSFFIARHLTVFDAGFALKTHGSLVKGLTPFLAGLAAFFFSFILSMPASLNAPVDLR